MTSSSWPWAPVSHVNNLHTSTKTYISLFTYVPFINKFIFFVNPFHTTGLSLNPLKKVFWRFQQIKKKNCGRKWVNKTINGCSGDNKQLDVLKSLKSAAQLNFNVAPPLLSVCTFEMYFKAFRTEWGIGEKEFCMEIV